MSRRSRHRQGTVTRGNAQNFPERKWHSSQLNSESICADLVVGKTKSGTRRHEGSQTHRTEITRAYSTQKHNTFDRKIPQYNIVTNSNKSHFRISTIVTSQKPVKLPAHHWYRKRGKRSNNKPDSKRTRRVDDGTHRPPRICRANFQTHTQRASKHKKML